MSQEGSPPAFGPIVTIQIELDDSDRQAIAAQRDGSRHGLRLADAQECREHLEGYVELAHEETGL